jgi:hypothetical protein
MAAGAAATGNAEHLKMIIGQSYDLSKRIAIGLFKEPVRIPRIRAVLNEATVSWHSRYSLRYQNYQ